ncbi:1-deoxy-11-beta-hydroxypentalenate dehydrogenase [Caulifigura coniformis]|uniref:1-deoxy-11-beta-hydroxypentalenate dehydrogenase n=1 Tax=Caulifigura coniformis TaxID=2527983 RepID=A0A517SGU9_9PLAN|nr:SDR family oxidoreductase [Caulifigura coniformis]QDT55340.1 1-deoxy-11-beta-hydroxypentalenate dehydrogenase [Caulifigura coniformis]
MQVAGKVIVVTGGANGIGRALCERFVHDGAKSVIVADLDFELASSAAHELGDPASAIGCNVAIEDQVRELVTLTLAQHGRIDLFCSNAGVTVKGTECTPDHDWQRLWDVNVMSHVYAARAVLPSMLERGEGYLLQTSSAAGILTEVGSAAYSVTKHAAVSFAEWLSIKYRRRGIRVSCLCPAGVQTQFLNDEDTIHQFLATSAVTPEDVAECVVQGLLEERFLLLPHHQVQEFFAFKGEDYDRWLHNFSRIAQKLERMEQKSKKPE